MSHSSLNSSSLQIEVLDLPLCQWGEGALWYEDHLLFVDINAGKVFRWHPQQDLPEGLETWEIEERVGFVVPRAQDEQLLIGTDSGLYLLNPKDGSKTQITDPEPNKPDNRFNDGKCSPDGRLFAGTISLIKNTGDAALYRLDPDHSISVAYPEVTTSNGIVWSEDGLTCYYIDTPKREVLAFDYDSATGILSNPRQAINTGHIDASPDGMTIDGQGQLWIAFCHGGCVARFDPQSGEETQRVELPALETTSCAFGGPNRNILYVTSGVHKSIEEEHGGKTFAIHGLGQQGVASPSHPFAG